MRGAGRRISEDRAEGLTWAGDMIGAIKLNLRKLLVFNLLSVADFFLTWQLLRKGGGQVYESNPVANAWLTSYGWIGLLVFKIAMVLLIGSIAVIVSFYRPRTSDRILMFACLVTAGVVVYSFCLSRALPVSSPYGPPQPWIAPAAPGRRTTPRREPQAFSPGLVATQGTTVLLEEEFGSVISWTWAAAP